MKTTSQQAPCARLVRRMIARAVESRGYRVSGNHIFSAAQWERVEAGRRAHAVAEMPAHYPARIARFADLLAATYTRAGGAA